jgi:hypothetical protein
MTLGKKLLLIIALCSNKTAATAGHVFFFCYFYVIYYRKELKYNYLDGSLFIHFNLYDSVYIL